MSDVSGILLETQERVGSGFYPELAFKPVQATKPTRLKTKAKVAKSDKKKQPTKKPKAKGLAVLSESKVPDEQQQKTSGIDEGIGTIPGVLDVPIYESESEKDSDDHDDSDDERTESDRDEIPDPNLTNIYDEENIDEEEEDEVTKELYDDVNVNLGNEDTKMTNVDQGALEQQNASQQSRFKQEEEDAQMTLTPVLDTQKIRGLTQSSSVSSDFTSKLLNLDNPSPADNEIASLMDTTTHHATTIPEITSSFSTPTPPPPLFFNPLSQQATPTPTPKDSKTKAATYDLKWNKDLVPKWYASNMTSSKDVYSRRRIIVVTRLKIMKMYDYGHWKRLKFVKMIKSYIHLEKVEYLQLGVKSYQKKLNLTKPDTYRSNLKNKTAYTSYSDPHGIIYMDEHKRKRLLRADKLHKFSDGMLNDVRSALHDIVAGIRLEYLPIRKWINLDKKRARVMVQDIDK
nr:hypothetical protein [Tanacetum cinerariifolium]